MCNEYLFFVTNHPLKKCQIIDFTRDFFIKNFWIWIDLTFLIPRIDLKIHLKIKI